MSQLIQSLFTADLLTLFRKDVPFYILQQNKPVAIPRQRTLSNPFKRGITLTLVISSEPMRHQTMAWPAIIMFNFFRVKTRIQIEIEEYISWKANPEGGNSPFIAKDQEKILKEFIKYLKCKSAKEITLEQIEAYHTKITREMTPYTAISQMKAIRAFLRFHKRDTEVIAEEVTNQGIIELQSVGKTDIVVPMIRPKPGRPMNVELVKQVKRLRDREKMSYRQISRALGKNIKSVYLMYKYDSDHVKSWQK